MLEVIDTHFEGPVGYIRGLRHAGGYAFEVEDARLIAAAPDLLAALERVQFEEADGRLTFSADLWGLITAAIAKAKGEV